MNGSNGGEIQDLRRQKKTIVSVKFPEKGKTGAQLPDIGEFLVKFSGAQLPDIGGYEDWSCWRSTALAGRFFSRLTCLRVDFSRRIPSREAANRHFLVFKLMGNHVRSGTWRVC